MKHINWITADDIVLSDDTVDNKHFIEHIKNVKEIRLLKDKTNYYLRYVRKNSTFWLWFKHYQNNGIFFGNVHYISPSSGLDEIENEYKMFNREDILKKLF